MKQLFATLKAGLNKTLSTLRLTKAPAPPPENLKHLIPGKVASATLRRFMRRPQRKGKLRGYRKRPALPGGLSYDQQRLNFIWESMRQGVEIARTRRAAYVARRTARFKKLVEKEVPRMFMQAMADLGMPLAEPDSLRTING